MKKTRGGVMKRMMSASLAAAMTVTGLAGIGSTGGAGKAASAKSVAERIPMILQYDEPATDWESQALPIGNGNIGAMVFGGVDADKLQINESSVWSGGPGSSPNYDGGENELSRDEVHNALQSVRQDIQDMVTDFSDNKSAYIGDNGSIISNNYTDLLNNGAFSSNLDKLKGEKNNFGSYQTFGNLNITTSKGASSPYTNYLRTSDIDNAVQTVSYTQDGVDYERMYFADNPSNVLVVKLTASKEGMITRNIYLDSEQSRKSISVNADEGTITMEGRPSDQGENGLKFAGYVKLIPEGGTISKADNNTLSVNNADSLVIIMSVNTNYKSDPTTEYNYFDGSNPLDKVIDSVDAAEEKGFDALYTEHISDYKQLYDRCVINLGFTDVPDKMTDDLLKNYNKANEEWEDKYLETLFFQYGRYLLISCSRENSKLPANLQGIWAQGLNPPWQSDYHTNINLQMNYWPAEQTNLTECHQILIDFINDMVEKGKVTAQKYYCKQDGSDVRGWVIHHENNIYGNTNPSNFTTAFYFPAAAAWQCQDIWEAYRFNDDKELLAEYYDTMLQAALFWVDNLWEDERDGKLVANPSYSPEHGVYSLGCTSDQAIIWEIFDEVIKASEVLGKSGDSEIAEIKAAKDNLYMPKADTLGGQYREWKDETTLEITNSDGHRHQNQLYVLHPGTYVVAGRSDEDNTLLEAAKVTLEKRGDGGTGWSKAWKINMWARLRDGDRARKLYGEQLTGSTLTNLFDTHAPFQIDGNFGATSGVAEMLIQSQGDCIEPLAALPSSWGEGYYSGLRARGDFDVSVKWHDGMADEIGIVSGSGNECKLRYEGVSDYYVLNMTNKTYVKHTDIDKDTISFKTKKDNEYLIAYSMPDGVFTEEKEEEPDKNPDMPAITAAPDSGLPADTVNNNVKPAKAIIKKLKAGKKSVIVFIKKKAKDATGYEIRYSVKKNMKKAKVTVIKKAKTLKKTIKKLASGRKYYVQIRSYRLNNKVKTYSKWSGKKTVIVK